MNLLETKAPSTNVFHSEAEQTLRRIIALQQKQPGIQLNLLVEGCYWDQLLQNGMRTQLFVAQVADAEMWDTLGVQHAPDDDGHKVQVRSWMLQSTSDGSHVRRVMLMERMVEVQPHDEPLCCHGNLCVREDRHFKKTCIPPRDVKEGRKVVGCLGFAFIGHMSAAKTLGLSDVYLNSSTALAIRRLLLGIMMQDELVLYI